MLNLSPLCGGLPPRLAWPYLKRVGEVVMPEAARPKALRAGGLGDALTELIVDAEDVEVTGASAVDLYYDPSISTSMTTRIRSGSGCGTTPRSTTTRNTTSTR